MEEVGGVSLADLAEFKADEAGAMRWAGRAARRAAKAGKEVGWGADR